MEVVPDKPKKKNLFDKAMDYVKAGYDDVQNLPEEELKNKSLAKVFKDEIERGKPIVKEIHEQHKIENEEFDKDK